MMGIDASSLLAALPGGEAAAGLLGSLLGEAAAPSPAALLRLAAAFCAGTALAAAVAAGAQAVREGGRRRLASSAAARLGEERVASPGSAGAASAPPFGVGGAPGPMSAGGRPAQALLAYLRRSTLAEGAAHRAASPRGRATSGPSGARPTGEGGRALAPDRLVRLIAVAGLSGEVSVAALRRAQVRLALLGGGAGFALGFIASEYLGLLLCACAACTGAAWPIRLLRARARERAECVERDLTRALDVLCLGLRSGLSLDRSLALYAAGFPSLLSADIEAMRAAWQSGLIGRDEAIRGLASRYDSELLGRTCSSIVRCLHLGSPLADGLAALSREGRQVCAAAIEEQVMKAPVKMMVPIGTLLLPALLLFVMGPVVLELAGRW